MRGSRVIDRIWAAGKDYALIVLSFDNIERGVEGPDLGIDRVVSDTSCDELVILASEIEDKYLLMRFDRHRFTSLNKINMIITHPGGFVNRI